MTMYASQYGYISSGLGVLGGQKEVLGPLKLELQMIVSHQMQSWEADSAPLHKQGAPSTSELSLQSSDVRLLNEHK